MNREGVIQALRDFAGPLGPFESLDAKLDRRDAWAAGADDSTRAALADVLAHPPAPADLTPADPEAAEVELTEMLVALAHADPPRFLIEFGPLANDHTARPILIDALGGLGHTEGLDVLQRVLQDDTATEDELVRLAGALGEIGGDSARGLLTEMRSQYAERGHRLAQAIDTALQVA